MTNKFSRWSTLMLFAAGLFSTLFLASCKDDDDDPVKNPIASFQYAISETNFLEVTFTNYSQNATSYDWNFGDGKTSTEANPVHLYDGPGNYTVVLTAKKFGKCNGELQPDHRGEGSEFGINPFGRRNFEDLEIIQGRHLHGCWPECRSGTQLVVARQQRYPPVYLLPRIYL